jgi:hypothetical protein
MRGVSEAVRHRRPTGFRAMWPDAAAVAWCWSNTAPRHQQALLADIALRANVFGPIRAETDRQAWIEEGRRQLALEIFKTAKTDIDLLWAQIEKRPSNTGETKR